jgi:hypothetical protein
MDTGMGSCGEIIRVAGMTDFTRRSTGQHPLDRFIFKLEKINFTFTHKNIATVEK